MILKKANHSLGSKKLRLLSRRKSYLPFNLASLASPPAFFFLVLTDGRSAWRDGGLERNSTFKYVHGSSTLDTKRSPAYTDRILYSFPCPTSTSPTPLSPCVPVSINKEKYTSHEELKWSDHRPVSCVFEVGVRKVDVEKRREGSRRAQKELDRLEEVWRPSLEIKVLPESRDAHAEEKEEVQEEDEGGIHFGKVRCREKKERRVRLKNGGKVPVSWNFRQAGIGRDICESFPTSFLTAMEFREGING